MHLSYKGLKNKQAYILAVGGEMDYNDVPIFKQAVKRGLKNGYRHFIFNLRKVEYLDSSALGCLLYNQKLISDQGGSVMLIPNPTVLDLLRLTHLTDYFTLATSKP